MSWEDQGRQRHGWFGHGTGPEDLADEAMFVAGNYDARIDSVAYTAFMGVKEGLRSHAGLTFDAERRAQLRTMMKAWIAVLPRRPALLDDLVRPHTSGTVIDRLREVAEGIAAAKTHKDLASPAETLGQAIQSVGLYEWPNFLKDAAARADSAPILLAQAGPAVATDARPAAPATPQPDRYIVSDPLQWNGHDLVGGGECVDLVKKAMNGMPQTSEWKQGIPVQGATDIQPGTIIATFDKNGHYRGHAGIYVGQDERGIKVIDQYKIYDDNGAIIDYKKPGFHTLYLNSPGRRMVNRGGFYNVVKR